MAALAKDTVYLLPDLKYGKFITEIIHAPEKNGFRILKLIQGATEVEKKDTQSYIDYEEYCSRSRDFREEFINEIARVILEVNQTDQNEEFSHYHYARLFHALAILKVPKDTKILCEKSKNYIYNSMYILWKLDDGSEDAYNTIIKSAYCMAKNAK